VWLATALIGIGLPMLYEHLLVKTVEKTNPDGIGKPMPIRAAASRTHSKLGES
jgi:hypothetical protein